MGAGGRAASATADGLLNTGGIVVAGFGRSKVHALSNITLKLSMRKILLPKW